MAGCVVAVAALVGCSVERSLDGESLGQQVQEQLFPEHPGLVTDVACPSLPDPEPGDSLACGLRLGEQIIDVEVVLVGEAEDLRATAVVDDRFVEASQIAEVLALTFSAEIGIVTTVDCGQPIVVLQPDEPVVCTATDPEGVQRHFDTRLADDGTVTIAIR